MSIYPQGSNIAKVATPTRSICSSGQLNFIKHLSSWVATYLDPVAQVGELITMKHLPRTKYGQPSPKISILEDEKLTELIILLNQLGID